LAIPAKKKITKKPMSRGGAAAVDLKALGPEPIIEGTIEQGNDVRYISALNWYNYMKDVEDARTYIVDWMTKDKYVKGQINAVRRANKNDISTTAGWQARMMMNGTKFNERSLEFFVDKLMYIFSREEKKVVDNPKPPIDIQARIVQKTNTHIELIENEIDAVMDGGTFSAYEFFKNNEVSAQSANIIRDFYLPAYEQLKTPDTQTKEAYGKTLKKWAEFYAALISDCDRFVNNKKAVRVSAPRKIKTKSAVDIIKELKFQKEDNALKIVSIHPTEVVGCQQLWTYNTKYKQLTVFNASGPTGITVKGTTLIGFDVEASSQKNLRKPEESIKQLLGSGKVALRKFMDTIKAVENKPSGRINENTILLKVTK
jgi:hypothetical protein